MNYQNAFTHINPTDLKYDEGCVFLDLIGKRHARKDKEKKNETWQKKQQKKYFLVKQTDGRYCDEMLFSHQPNW